MFEDLFGFDLGSKGSLSNSSSDSPNLVTGFVAAAIAVVGFGSNFVPAKKIYSGDGIFFQFVSMYSAYICV